MKYSAEAIGKLIKFEREKRNWTQKKLGEELSVSGKQVSNYEKGIPMPPIDVLVKLCEVFDCELGYILGEEDYSEGSKIRTAIYNAMGLTTASIDVILKVTGTHHGCIEFGYQAEKYRRILNSLFLSPRFIEFMDNLGDLDDRIAAYSSVEKQLVEKLGDSLLDEAFTYYSSTTDYFNDPNADKLRPELYEAIALIESCIKKQEELSYPIKIARYELRDSFEFLINDIYPRHHE